MYNSIFGDANMSGAGMAPRQAEVPNHMHPARAQQLLAQAPAWVHDAIRQGQRTPSPLGWGPQQGAPQGPQGGGLIHRGPRVFGSSNGGLVPETGLAHNPFLGGDTPPGDNNFVVDHIGPMGPNGITPFADRPYNGPFGDHPIGGEGGWNNPMPTPPTGGPNFQSPQGNGKGGWDPGAPKNYEQMGLGAPAPAQPKYDNYGMPVGSTTQTPYNGPQFSMNATSQPQGNIGFTPNITPANGDGMRDHRWENGDGGAFGPSKGNIGMGAPTPGFAVGENDPTANGLKKKLYGEQTPPVWNGWFNK